MAQSAGEGGREGNSRDVINPAQSNKQAFLFAVLFSCRMWRMWRRLVKARRAWRRNCDKLLCSSQMLIYLKELCFRTRKYCAIDRVRHIMYWIMSGYTYIDKWMAEEGRRRRGDMSSLTRNKLAKIQMRQIFLLYFFFFFFGCHSFHHPSPLLYLFDCVCSRKHVKECLCKFTIDTGVKDSFWRTLLPPSLLLSFIYKSSLCCNISSTSPSPPLLILTLHEILLSNALYPWPSLPCRAVIMCSCNLSDSLTPFRFALNSVLTHFQVHTNWNNSGKWKTVPVYVVRIMESTCTSYSPQHEHEHGRCIKLGAEEESNCNLHDFLWGTI